METSGASLGGSRGPRATIMCTVECFGFAGGRHVCVSGPSPLTICRSFRLRTIITVQYCQLNCEEHGVIKHRRPDPDSHVKTRISHARSDLAVVAHQSIVVDDEFDSSSISAQTCLSTCRRTTEMAAQSQSTARLDASCHCGAVKIQLPHRPREINECQCTICVCQLGGQKSNSGSSFRSSSLGLLSGLAHAKSIEVPSGRDI